TGGHDTQRLVRGVEDEHPHGGEPIPAPDRGTGTSRPGPVSARCGARPGTTRATRWRQPRPASGPDRRTASPSGIAATPGPSPPAPGAPPSATAAGATPVRHRGGPTRGGREERVGHPPSGFRFLRQTVTYRLSPLRFLRQTVTYRLSPLRFL